MTIIRRNVGRSLQESALRHFSKREVLKREAMERNGTTTGVI